MSWAGTLSELCGPVLTCEPGGGIIGCTTAYYLTRHPAYDPTKHKITILEATRIAGGASGKAGGLLAIWAYPNNIVPLSYRLHAELAEEHDGAEKWGYRKIQCGNIGATGRDRKEMVGTAAATGLSLGKMRKGKAGARREEMEAGAVPTDLDWILPELVTSYEAMGDADSTAQVHPYYFTQAMCQMAEDRGAKLVIGKVESLEYEEIKGPMMESDIPPGPPSPAPSVGSTSPSSNRKVTGVTYLDKDSGETITISATTTILAAGPWTQQLYPSAPITGLRAHSVTITPAAPVSGYALFTEITVPPIAPSTSPAREGRRRGRRSPPADVVTVAPEIYARPNNEIYVCGEGDMEEELPPSTADVVVDESRCDDLIAQVSSISDHIRLGRVTRKQACYLPIMSVGATGGPLIGWTDTEGLILASGHSCWGINNAPATGLVISELVFDGEAKSAEIKGCDPRRIL